MDTPLPLSFLFFLEVVFVFTIFIFFSLTHVDCFSEKTSKRHLRILNVYYVKNAKIQKHIFGHCKHEQQMNQKQNFSNAQNVTTLGEVMINSKELGNFLN